jgi:hypothetical protein
VTAKKIYSDGATRAADLGRALRVLLLNQGDYRDWYFFWL